MTPVTWLPWISLNIPGVAYRASAAGGSTFAGIGAYAVNRTELVAGNPAPTVISFPLRLSPIATVHWQDEIFFQDNNFDEGPFHSGQEAYTTINASLRLINEAKRWGAELYVYNLTDERTRYWADYGPGYIKSSFAPPRAYGIKFRYDF